MEKTVFKFIRRHSIRQQVVILITTLISFLFLYFSLDLPKIIINKTIGGITPKQKLVMGMPMAA